MIKSIREAAYCKSLIHVCLLYLILSLAASNVFSATTEGDVDITNYAFATYLGTGIYVTSGRTVQVYQIPFSYTAREIKDNNYGLKVTLPVTFGFFDFKSSDVLENNLPSEVAIGSFIPGLEYQYPVNEYWLVSPFVDVGIAKNFSTGDSIYIYGAGLKNRIKFNWELWEFTIGNRLLYAAHSGDTPDDSNDFSSVETGIEVIYPSDLTIFNKLLKFSLYYVNYRYPDKLQFSNIQDENAEVKIQNEVGFTLVFSQPIESRWLDVPRIGLGYRTGDNLSITRLIFGIPF